MSEPLRLSHRAAGASRASLYLLGFLTLSCWLGSLLVYALTRRDAVECGLVFLFGVWTALRMRRTIWSSEIVIDRGAKTLRALVRRFPFGRAEGTTPLSSLREVRTLNASPGRGRGAGYLRTTAVGLMREGAPAMIITQEPMSSRSMHAARELADRLAKELGLRRTGS